MLIAKPGAERNKSKIFSLGRCQQLGQGIDACGPKVPTLRGVMQKHNFGVSEFGVNAPNDLFRCSVFESVVGAQRPADGLQFQFCDDPRHCGTDVTDGRPEQARALAANGLEHFARLVEIAPNATGRTKSEETVVVVAVQPERVAIADNGADKLGMRFGLFSNDEKGSLNLVLTQQRQHLGGGAGVRTVVKAQRDTVPCCRPAGDRIDEHAAVGKADAENDQCDVAEPGGDGPAQGRRCTKPSVSQHVDPAGASRVENQPKRGHCLCINRFCGRFRWLGFRRHPAP